MPRIDPLQLLKCLSVLLTPSGGILSKEEVPRLVNLMTKFSKKLVSKCVYVLILKVTESELVDLFMAEGGWNLVQTWLQDAMHVSNWDLVNEILGLLLITPVDVERLKLNTIPKLVKNLSRRDDLPGVQSLSSQLVQHWLIIVKSNANSKAEIATEKHEVTEEVDSESNDSKAIAEDVKIEEKATEKENEVPEETVKKEEEEKEKEKDRKSSGSSRSRDKKKGYSSSSSSSSRSSSSRDKSRDKDRKDRDKDRAKDRDRDRHRSNGSSKHGSSSSRSSSSKDRRSSKDKDRDTRDRSKQAEKDKDTLAKLKPQSIDKLGKIPRKPDEKKEEVRKKPTMSIEVRKNKEERPKTVKIFNSKMRSTGLEEEVKPPPPRAAVAKKAPPSPVVVAPVKRPSPPRDTPANSPQMPPEKKLRIDAIIDKMERPGAIKLIPPKPKPTILQESDIFMDALTAATTKKEPKKRKRRPSVSKETPSSPSTASSAGETKDAPTSPLSSPLGIKSIAPINFYQDTLGAETNGTESEKENQEAEETVEDKKEEEAPPPAEDDSQVEAKRGRVNEDGLKGVLCYTKKKGPKRSIKWKTDDDLVEIRYFELDETERVNVTKTFMDMAKMDMCGEREAVILSRKLPNEDIMGQQTIWRLPYLIDQTDSLAAPGAKSLEKDIQFAREKNVLPAHYFDKRRIPESPFEPDPENHQMKDPVIIPLDDPDGQENDLRNTPWPEPKGSPPHVEPPPMPPNMFPNMLGPFNPNFPQMPPQAFQGGMPPRFNGPNFMPPNMLHNGSMMGGPPNMGPPPDMMFAGPGQEQFNNDAPPNFPPHMPFANPAGMGGNMFPPNNFNMGRGGGPNRGGGGFRGRGNNNNGPWVRLNGPGAGPGNWNRGGGAGGHRGGRLCKNVKNHGYCRNRDNCPFIHPN